VNFLSQLKWLLQLLQIAKNFDPGAVPPVLLEAMQILLGVLDSVTLLAPNSPTAIIQDLYSLLVAFQAQLKDDPMAAAIQEILNDIANQPALEATLLSGKFVNVMTITETLAGSATPIILGAFTAEGPAAAALGL
jgi:hypothetical protein